MVKLHVYDNNNKRDKKRNYLCAELPQPSFRYVVLGGTGTGKTNVILNMLFNKKHCGYAKYFDEIYAWVGNPEDYRFMANKVKQRNIKNIKLFRHYDPEELKNLWDEIQTDAEEELEEDKDPNRILMVFDDMILAGISDSHRRTTLDEIYIKGRHYGVSLLLSTQKYSMLNQNMRKDNVSHLSIFNPMNKEELSTIWKENIAAVDQKTFMDLFNKHANKRYSFITVDKTNPDVPFRDKNFDPIKINID